MTDILKDLSAPFPPAKISWRVGPVNNKDNPTSGIALAYIDARDVQDRLDEVCGVNWQSRYPHAAQKTVCEIGIKIDGEWYWRADGAGDTDMEAEKGSLSDAFKRAAVKWGVGRYLYDVDSPWVDVVKKGRSVVIADKELPRLQKLLPGSKAATAPSQPAQTHDWLPAEKNPPGISKVAIEVREAVREINSCCDGDALIAFLPSIKELCIKCAHTYKSQWTGPEQFSGLRGAIEKFARDQGADFEITVRRWLEKVEAAQPQQQAAE